MHLDCFDSMLGRFLFMLKSCGAHRYKFLATMGLPVALGLRLQHGVNIYSPVFRTKAANGRARTKPGQWRHVCCEAEACEDAHNQGQRGCLSPKPVPGDVNTHRGHIPFCASVFSARPCLPLPPLDPVTSGASFRKNAFEESKAKQS